MRVLVVADDSVHPCNSGGRQALKGDLEVLRNAVDVLDAVYFYRGKIRIEHAQSNAELVDNAHHLRRRSLLASTLTHPGLPYQTSSRLYDRFSLDLDRPDVIVAEHDWCLPFASFIANAFSDFIPVILRSHNNELQFMSSLARNAGRVRAIYYRAEAMRLKRQYSLYPEVLKEVWLLSEDDAGAYPGAVPSWLFKPVMRPHLRHPLTQLAGDPHVLFLGALDMSHTEAGLIWFVEKVWPRIRQQHPSARFIVAGRNGRKSLVRVLERARGVDFAGEVDDVEELISRDCIFVNPIFDGSGVNMKLALPASHGRSIVSTSFGLRGLSDLAPGVVVADDEDLFEQAINSLMADCEKRRRLGSILQEAVLSYSAECISHEVGMRLRSVVDVEGEK